MATETIAITPGTAGAIQHAKAEELSVMTEEVISVNNELNRANNELDLLEDALRQLSCTREKYNQKSTEVRKRMQRLATQL